MFSELVFRECVIAEKNREGPCWTHYYLNHCHQSDTILKFACKSLLSIIAEFVWNSEQLHFQTEEAGCRHAGWFVLMVRYQSLVMLLAISEKKIPSRRIWSFICKGKYSPLQNERFAMARHLHVPVSRFSKLCLYFMPIALAQSPCHSNPCNDHFWNIYTPCLAGWLLLTQ